VLHSRDAYDDVIQMLKDFFPPPIRGMAHCFSGTPDHMEQMVHLGLHVSFAGPVTYKKNDALREAVQSCPLNRILTETDAPYLPPQSMRGKRNEPMFMVETVKQIADLKGIDPDELGNQTLRNAEHLFGFKLLS
jgi:TatD DNase family protein